VRLDLRRRRSVCSASQVRELSATRSRRISARFSLFEGGFGFCLLNDLAWFVRACSAGDQRVALGGEHALLQRHDPWPGTVAL